MVALVLAATLAVRLQASQTYQVKQGDNLWKIARKYKVDVRSLAAANGLREEDELKLHCKLIIPKDRRAKAPASIPVRRNPVPTARQRGKLLEDRVCVRGGPGTRFRKLTVLDSNIPLILTAKAKGWYQILLPDGTKGWIRADFIKPGKMMALASRTAARRHVAPARGKQARKMAAIRSRRRQIQLEERRRQLAARNNRKGTGNLSSKTEDDLIRMAYAYRGIRYRSGGTTSRSGFDCSGFTRYVYAKKGVRLPHSSRSQYGIGQSVPESQLQAGDLVFFRTTRKGISHVGIYVGNGKFIHASNHSRGVTVDSLHSGYYSPRYVGARRVK